MSTINYQLSIIYMGTPEFAVEGLRALVENGYKVVAVVTISPRNSKTRPSWRNYVPTKLTCKS